MLYQQNNCHLFFSALSLSVRLRRQYQLRLTTLRVVRALTYGNCQGLTT